MLRSIKEDFILKLKGGNPVIRLIIINVLVFLTLGIFKVLFSLSNGNGFISAITEGLLSVFYFPLSFNGIAYHFWAIFTYSFAHIELMHILFNMLALYWFGNILQEYTSSKKIIPLYIMGGIAGALFAVLCIELIPALHHLRGVSMIGASAGITAIIVAAASLVPEYRVRLLLFGEIKLLYIAAFTVIISFLSVGTYSNVGGNLSHIGGAILGYCFFVAYKKGIDITRWMTKFFEKIALLFQPVNRTKMNVVYKKKLSDEEYNYIKRKEEQRVDELLDKISKSGYDSLSKSERDFLASINKQK